MSALRPRRAARMLVRHALHVLPPAQADWGQAMQSEIHHIGNDAEALRWALGCVWTSYRVRSASMSKLVMTLVRIGLAGVIALYALAQLPVALMVLGYKTGNLDLSGAMDGVTAGDDFHRFGPLMEQMSWLQLGVSFVECALFLGAAVALLARWRRAPHLFAAALVLHLVGWLSTRALPAFHDTFSAAEMNQDLVVMAVLVLIGAAAFWLNARRSPQPDA